MSDLEVLSHMEYWQKLIGYHSALLREALDEYAAWRAKLEVNSDKSDPD